MLNHTFIEKYKKYDVLYLDEFYDYEFDNEDIFNKCYNAMKELIKNGKKIVLASHFEFEKAITLRVIDTYWMEHINTMSILREGIGLRGYAQENLFRAYTNEGFELFQELLVNIAKQSTLYLLKSEIRQNIERKQVEKPLATDDVKEKAKKQPKVVNTIGRNDKCPCGSGKKHKQCCGR